jgi:hypothetical protein
MALVLDDRVRETTSVTGTNDAILLGAVVGFQSFAVIGNSNTCYYTIADQAGGAWEVGIGTYLTAGPTLQRDTILASSNSGNKVVFSAGTKDVFVTYPSEKAVYLDASGNVQPNLGTVTATQVDITAQGDLRLQDTSGGEYVALQAPGTLSSSYTLTLPVDDGSNGQALITDGNGVLSWSTAASGDVYGPASATDNAIARFDGTTGKIIQNSVVTIADTTGDMAGVGTISSGAITSSSLTSTRVLYAGTSGLIQDSANMTFNGTTLTVTGINNTGNTTLGDAAGDTTTINGTAVSIPNSLNFDSNTFYIDATNNRIGVGNAAPTVSVTITASDAMLIPAGAVGSRPAGVAGYLRFNTTSNEFEGYNGTAWASVGGSAITNDTSTATDLYPAFLNATTGTATSIFTSNAKLLYKPSTGELKASEVLATNGVFVNNQTMATSYSMPSGYSGMSTGPFTIGSGVTFTIPSGSRHVVL